MYNQPFYFHKFKRWGQFKLFLKKLELKVKEPLTKCYICSKLKLKKNRVYLTHRVWVL